MKEDKGTAVRMRKLGPCSSSATGRSVSKAMFTLRSSKVGPGGGGFLYRIYEDAMEAKAVITDVGYPQLRSPVSTQGINVETSAIIKQTKQYTEHSQPRPLVNVPQSNQHHHFFNGGSSPSQLTFMAALERHCQLWSIQG